MIHPNKLGLILIAIAVFIGGPSQAQQKVEGAFIHAPVQTHLYLFKSSNTGWVTVDTMAANEGNFVFTLDSKLPRSWYKIGPDQRNSFDVILGNEDVKITGDFNQLSNSVSFGASPENDLLKNYLSYYQRDQAARKRLLKKSTGPTMQVIG